jgi:hypothetical protein
MVILRPQPKDLSLLIATRRSFAPLRMTPLTFDVGEY